MINTYKGNDPFIFISYSHKDTDLVLPCVEALSKKGYRVWYDNGIEAGTEWPEYIAERLMSSGSVIAFVSKNAQDSHNCRREINFAIELKKELLIVYLEDFQLTPGMRLQLGSLQALFAYHNSDREIFYNNLCNATLLAPCLSTPEAEQIVENAPANNSKDEIAPVALGNDVIEESCDGKDSSAHRDALIHAIKVCNKSFKEHKHASEFKFKSDLKEKQLTNALLKVKNKVSADDVIAVMDNTIFSTGKSGFVITEDLLISNEWLFNYVMDLHGIVSYTRYEDVKITFTYTDKKAKTYYFGIYRESFIDFFDAYFSYIKEH